MGFALGIDECNSTGKGTGVNLFLCFWGMGGYKVLALTALSTLHSD